MVPSTIRKIFSLAISLLVVVISLTGVALGAIAPTVATLTSGPNSNGRYTPDFVGDPGKMAQDESGNFYVADFWGKGIVKLNGQGSRIGFIATSGRPTAVAVMKDNRLVVAMSAPQVKIAFYKQFGVSPNVSGEEDMINAFGDQGTYRPVAITTDSSEYIYVLDGGDSSTDAVNRVPKIRVYNSNGVYQNYAIGLRTDAFSLASVATTITSDSDARMKQPSGIAYEKVGNKVYVADTLNFRLLIFSAYDGSKMTLVPTTPGPGSFIGKSAGFALPTINSNPVTFTNPVDIAFQYNDNPSPILQRIYVLERGIGEISVLDATTNRSTKYIGGKYNSGQAMKLPSSVLFQRTGTGVSLTGVLYAGSVATDTAANILALGIDGGTVPASTVAMTLNAVPATSSASPITVTGTTSPGTAVACSVNGVAGGTPSGTASWSVSGLVLQPDKTNYILCQSVTGNASAGAYTYFGAPTGTTAVAITAPSSGNYTNNTSVTVTGTTTPANASVKLVNSLGGTTYAPSDAAGNWSQTVTLAEGSNLLTATAMKVGFTDGPSQAVTVDVDLTPPNMTGTISFIAAGSTTTSAVQNLDGIVLDANLQSITVNGMSVSAAAKVAMAGNNTYFSVPVILERDSNIVTVTATDKAGNSTTLARSVTLAPEKPGLIVALPADNKFKAAVGTESASGTIDPTFTSVVACGTSVSPSAGIWSATTPSIGSGFVSCQFTASGGGNTTVNEKRTFNTNVTYGNVSITAPPTDIATNTSSVIISGSVDAGAATPQIVINGAAAVNVGVYNSVTGAFSHTVALLEGLNTLKIVSNATTTVRNVIYDKIPPVMSILADSNSMPSTIHGSLEPSAKISAITATLRSVPVVIPVSIMTFDTYNGSGAVSWHANLNGYTYDTISFSSIDPAGNLATIAYEKGVPTGDIDGDGTVRLADALAALRHLAGTDEITDPTKLFNGDVGALVAGRAARDGVIDITDSVLILNKAYGLMTF